MQREGASMRGIAVVRPELGAFFACYALVKGSAMNRPKIIDDPAYHCLREDNVECYRKHIEGRQEIDFSNSDLRGVDLRAADLAKVKLRGAYLRDADLRGQDLRHIDLEGCSLLGARIGGTYFPANLTAQEIANSVQFGT